MTTLPPHPGLSGLAAREATTSADVTRAADDDADHRRSDFTGVHLDRLAALARQHSLYTDPIPCGCCGPRLCCCLCHKEER